MIGLSYLLIFSGIILIYIIEEDTQIEIYFLIGVIVLEISGLITIVKALKIFRSLEDKSVYPKQLDFLNRMAVKLHSDRKKSNIVVGIAIIVGFLTGIIIILYKERLLF